MAFVVKNITQVSYYFSIRIIVDTTVYANNLPSVDFVKIIQIDRCSPSNAGQCQVEVQINSSLLFCKDSTCALTSTIPFYVLYLNRVFWMLHQINDVTFQNFYINSVSINYQAFGFSLNLLQGDYKILQHNMGSNIYELHVPIVAQQVLISAFGTMSQTARRILDATNTTGSIPVTHVSANTGVIAASANSSAVPIDSSSSASNVQTASVFSAAFARGSGVSSVSDKANNGIIIVLSSAILAALLF